MRRTLRDWWRRRRFEQDLSEELRFHVDMRAAEFERQGMPPAEARRHARMELGGLETNKEDCRRARGLRWVDEFSSDLRYALRGIGRNRSFAAVAVLTLALGTGVNTTIFSLVNAVMYKMLPVGDPAELRMIYWTAPRFRPGFAKASSGSSYDKEGILVRDMFAYPHFRELRQMNQGKTEIFASAGLGQVNVIVNGQAQLARGLAVSGNYFPGLGLNAWQGRAIQPADENQGAAAPPVVLSHAYWTRAFGADLKVIGQPLTIGDQRLEIAGVMPEGFHGVSPGDSVDLWLPLEMYERLQKEKRFDNTRTWWIQMMARVRAPETTESLQARLEPQFLGLLAAEGGPAYEPPKIRIEPGGQGVHWLRTSWEKPLRLLLFVATLVLLMAAANVGGLLVARAEARTAEFATRLAIGAGRLRLIRQHLTESLLLAAMGAAGGLALTWLLRDTLPRILASGDRIPVLDLAPDGRLLAVTIATVFAITLLFGLYPAWRSSRVELNAAMKRVHGARSGRLPMGRILVAVQVGLSVVLLVAAGMFLHTVANLRAVKLGFVPERVYLFSVDGSLAGYRDERLNTYYRQAFERLEAIPGVKAVGISQMGLLQGGMSSTTMHLRGATTVDGKNSINVHLHRVNAQYLAAMGIPLLAGRNLTDRDSESAERRILVNETLARKLAGESGRASVLGMRLFGEPDGREPGEVVGVVGDVKYSQLRGETPATMYAPFFGAHPRNARFALRTDGEALAIAADVQRVMAEVDPRVPLYEKRTQEEQISLAMQRERILAQMLAGFGALALTMAAMGVYGVLSYAVTRRTAEIGIRMALGAAPWRLRRMILRESLGPVAGGMLGGLGIAWAGSSLLATLVYGVEAMDPWAVAGALALLALGAFTAAWLPAYRASRVAPVTALRYE